MTWNYSTFDERWNIFVGALFPDLRMLGFSSLRWEDWRCLSNLLSIMLSGYQSRLESRRLSLVTDSLKSWSPEKRWIWSFQTTFLLLTSFCAWLFSASFSVASETTADQKNEDVWPRRNSSSLHFHPTIPRSPKQGLVFLSLGGTALPFVPWFAGSPKKTERPTTFQNWTKQIYETYYFRWRSDENLPNLRWFFGSPCLGERHFLPAPPMLPAPPNHRKATFDWFATRMKRTGVKKSMKWAYIYLLYILYTYICDIYIYIYTLCIYIYKCI